jgi:protein-glutamine gamma-glutamyltransferase
VIGVRAADATVRMPHAPARDRRRWRADARLPVVAARMPTFLALAAIGAHAWVQMVAPAAWGAMAAALVSALVVGLLLIAVARRGASRRARGAAMLLAGAAMLVVALAAAGVPADLAGPRSWGELAAGIGQGLSAVPNVHVPFRGVEQWTRIVVVLGCGVLVAVATLLAFAPRRGRSFGFPLAAAAVLAVLYLVPAMQRTGSHPYLDGAGLALLLALFLWLERVDRAAAPTAVAAVVLAVAGALAIGPWVDGGRPLLDYARLAQSLGDGPSTRYDWNHDYGPLTWPRQGTEVLRVQARYRSYWKAANLSDFDGTRWLQAREAPEGQLTRAFDTGHQDWFQTIRVTFRALRSTQFVGAGTTLEIRDSPRNAVPSGSGVFATQTKPLEQGNAYHAVVYTPRPTAGEMQAAAARPIDVGGALTSVGLPAPRHAGSVPARGRTVTIPAWGHGPVARATVAAIDASPYRGAYELARHLRAHARTPYAFMRAVEHHLAHGYAYSESPARTASPLEDFLFDHRAGYCQQFSGAMALLLRFGGIPARVAAGFAPGVYDAERKEFVVRDVDAHSWVEVFFPGIGWVTRDPTPAASPARSQLDDKAPKALVAQADVVEASGTSAGRSASEATTSPARRSHRRDPSPALLAALALVTMLAATALVLAIRRRRRPDARPDPDDAPVTRDLAELRRALRRSRTAIAAPTTLAALAARFGDAPAAGYVHALREARYGYGDGAPTAAQRAALRRGLAADRGALGRLRSWWALPPRPRRRASGSRAPRHVT